MAEFKNKLIHITHALADKMVEGDAKKWPPACPALIYQPVRPKTAPVFEEKSDRNSAEK